MPQDPLGSSTCMLVETIGSRNSQTWGQISGSTLLSCVTLDKARFLSELQKTGIIVPYDHWIM